MYKTVLEDRQAFFPGPELGRKYCLIWICVYSLICYKWIEEQKQNHIFLDIAGDGRSRIKMITEAGIIGKIGFNEHGVGACLNAIKVPGCDSSRLPVHFALRLVMESPSADAAVRKLEKVGVAASAHILVADKEKAIGVESTGKTIKLIHMGKRDRVLHANHLLLEHDGVVHTGWLADSSDRQQRIEHLALTYDSIGRAPESADIIRMLDDHEGFPYSICRYEEGPLGMDATLFSIVIDLARAEALVYLGRPCQAEETVVLGFQA